MIYVDMDDGHSIDGGTLYQVHTVSYMWSWYQILSAHLGSRGGCMMAVDRRYIILNVLEKRRINEPKADGQSSGLMEMFGG